MSNDQCRNCGQFRSRGHACPAKRKSPSPPPRGTIWDKISTDPSKISALFTSEAGAPEGWQEVFREYQKMKEKTVQFKPEPTLEREQWGARHELAQDINTPPPILAQFASSPDESIRILIAMNPSTPAASLSILSKDVKPSVRLMVARNKKTPQEALERLSHDVKKTIRNEVAQNPNTPVRVLLRLLQDEDSAVRTSALKNKRIPRKTLEELARSSTDLDTLRTIWRNPSCTPAIKNIIKNRVAQRSPQ